MAHTPQPDTRRTSFTHVPCGLHVGRCPPQPVSLLGPSPHALTLLPIGSGYFRTKLFPVYIPHHFLLIYSFCLPAYEDGTDRVPKRRHIKFSRRGITQNKAYKIQNTAKFWNQELHKTSSVQGAVSRRPLTAEARVRHQVNLRRNTYGFSTSSYLSTKSVSTDFNSTT